MRSARWTRRCGLSTLTAPPSPPVPVPTNCRRPARTPFAPEQTIGNVDSNIAEAAADTPTKDEFDKLVTAFNTLAKQFDDTIAGLVSAGAVKLPDKK